MDYSDEGQLQVIIGPMFSGKTSELIRRIQRYHLASYRSLIVKFPHSNQVEHYKQPTAKVTSHDDQSLPAIHAERLKEIEKLVEEVEVIGIDEGHLFPDLMEFCEKMSDLGKTIVVAGLDGCGKDVFHQILNIIPLAESVSKLTAICVYCGDDANYTTPTSTKNGKQEASNYIPVCGKCFEKPQQNWLSPFKEFLVKNGK